MSHRPAQTAAAYLAGELSGAEREAFEGHLLECDECWTEVDAGRQGLAAVESIRELAPSHLRAAVRRRLTTARAEPRARDRRWHVAAAATVVAVAGVAAVGVATRGPSDAAVIDAAVAAYANHRLPGSDMPKMPAPDLSSLHLKEMGAGAGKIDDMPVTAFGYRDDTGRRLVVYVGTAAFPMPERADMLDGPDGAWMAHRDGISVLASRTPHQLLIVGADQQLVHDAAVALDIM